MNEKCVWVEVAWDGIIPALLAKKIDVIVSSMSITEERMKTIDFSDKYYNTPAVIVAPKSSSIDGMPDSVKGKIVGVQVSTTHANYAEKHLRARPTASRPTRPSMSTIRIWWPAASTRWSAIRWPCSRSSTAMRASAVRSRASSTISRFSAPALAAACARVKPSCMHKFNAAIKKIREDGTFDAISKKYFTSISTAAKADNTLCPEPVEGPAPRCLRVKRR